MFIEMQITAGKLGAILRQRVEPRALSVDVEFPWQATTWVVDRIVLTDDTAVDRATTTTSKSVWGSGTYYSVDAPQMQVIQPVQIHLVDRATMLANGVNESTPAHVFKVRLVFNLDLTPQSLAAGVPAPVALTATLDHIDWLFLGLDDTLQAFRAAVEQQAKEQLKIPDAIIDLAPVMQLLSAAGASNKGGAVNAGIQCDPARNVAALRFQLTGWPKSTAGWEWPNFLTQGPADLTADDEWAMVVDFRVLEPSLRTGMQQGMDKPNLRLNDGPHINWHAGKGLHIYVAGEVIDACKQFIEDTDVDFDAKIDLTFGVKPGGVLTMAGTLDAGPTDPLEVIGCIFTAATLFPFLGLEMLADGKITFWEYAGGVLGTGLPLAVYAILAMDDMAMGKTKVPSKLGTMTCQQNEDDISCQMPLKGSFGGVALQFTRASNADARGPVIAGTMRPSETHPALTVTADLMAWRVAGACDTGYSVECSGLVDATVSDGGVVTSVAVVDDPKEAYELKASGSRFVLTGGNFAALPFQKIPPYPPHVKIVSSAGCRIIDLGMRPPAVTPELQTEFAERIKQYVRGCEKMKEAANGYIIHFPDDVEMPGDPPRMLWDLDVWRIGFDAIAPGSVIELRDDNERVLRTIAVDSAEPIATVITGDRRHPLSRVSVVINGRPMTDGDGRLAARQLQYRQLGSVQIPAGSDAWLSGDRSHLRLVASVGDDIHMVDLSDPRSPRRLPIGAADERVTQRPARGITRHDPTLLATADLLVRIEPDTGRAHILELERTQTFGSSLQAQP